jgi:hypothetical protein
MAQYREELPKTISVTCTDNDQVVEADLYSYHEGKHMDVILNTVRIRLVWQGRFYVGNMTGYEFTAPEPRKTVFKQHR